MSKQAPPPPNSEAVEAPLPFAGRPEGFAGTSLEQRVQELADREEIRDLIATYAHRVAHGLSNADLFTDDGAYIHRRSPEAEPEVARGRVELDAHYVERPGSAGVATPMIHNPLVSVSGDEASSFCSIELRLWRDGASALCSGFYRDRLRREAGRWKFVEREVSFFHWTAPERG
jgi:hypothetical protein